MHVTFSSEREHETILCNIVVVFFLQCEFDEYFGAIIFLNL